MLPNITCHFISGPLLLPTGGPWWSCAQVLSTLWCFLPSSCSLPVDSASDPQPRNWSLALFCPATDCRHLYLTSSFKEQDLRSKSWYTWEYTCLEAEWPWNTEFSSTLDSNRPNLNTKGSRTQVHPYLHSKFRTIIKTLPQETKTKVEMTSFSILRR